MSKDRITELLDGYDRDGANEDSLRMTSELISMLDDDNINSASIMMLDNGDMSLTWYDNRGILFIIHDNEYNCYWIPSSGKYELISSRNSNDVVQFIQYHRAQ